jgi:hypothetical protein
LSESLSSATNHEDDPVGFEVTEDVKVGDVLAIPRGASAHGHVVEVEPKRRMGRAGKLNFTLDYVRAPDGTNIRLRASSERKGQDKTGTVIVGTVLVSPLFLIMHGKDVNIPKGTSFNAYVDGDRQITLGGPPPATPAATPAPPSALTATPQQVPAAPAEELATIVVKSIPDGADITVDGKFVGSTPSTVRLPPGDHTVALEKSGYKTWQRTMTVGAGASITIGPMLEKNPE